MKKMGSRFRNDAFDYTIKEAETMTVFERLGRMADADMDIRLASLDNIVELKVCNKGGEVTFGVDGRTIMDLIAGKRFVGGFLLADKEQFESISERTEHDDKETSLEGDEIPSYRELMIRRDCVDLEIEDDSDSVVEAGEATVKIEKDWPGLSPGAGERLLLVDGEDVLAVADVNAFPGIRAGDTFEVTWKLVLEAPAGDKDEEA